MRPQLDPRAKTRARGIHNPRQSNYWRPQLNQNGWSEERRKAQASAIRQWCPWKQSTGPRSAEGKARVSRNAYRGALRAEWRQLSKVLTLPFGEQRSNLLLPAIDRLEQLMLQNESAVPGNVGHANRPARRDRTHLLHGGSDVCARCVLTERSSRQTLAPSQFSDMCNRGWLSNSVQSALTAVLARLRLRPPGKPHGSASQRLGRPERVCRHDHRQH